MKLSTLMAAFALFILLPFGANAMDKEHSSMTEAKTIISEPAIKAVVFYSDTCGSCKILEPRMMKAMGAVNKDKIDVVKFDFSNKASIEATKQLAKDKNIDSILQQYGAKTGFVVLVNNAGEIVDTIKVDNDAVDIASKLTSAVLNAS